jgi:hypothetical protein
LGPRGPIPGLDCGGGGPARWGRRRPVAVAAAAVAPARWRFSGGNGHAGELGEVQRKVGSLGWGYSRPEPGAGRGCLYWRRRWAVGLRTNRRRAGGLYSRLAPRRCVVVSARHYSTYGDSPWPVCAQRTASDREKHCSTTSNWWRGRRDAWRGARGVLGRGRPGKCAASGGTRRGSDGEAGGRGARDGVLRGRKGGFYRRC